MVLPLSLKHFWEAFYADDAPYFTETAFIRDERDTLNSSTLWFEPTEETFKTSFGKPVQ